MEQANQKNNIREFAIVTLQDDIVVNVRFNIEQMVRNKHALAKKNKMYVVFLSFYGGDNMQIFVPQSIMDNNLLEKEELAEYNESGCKINIMGVEHLFSSARNGMTELKEVEI